MAITGPYVGQAPKKRDPFEIGVQLGSQMQQLGQFFEQQRQYDIATGFETLKYMAENTAGGVMAFAKQSPGFVQNWLSKVYRTSPNDPKVQQAYKNFSTGLQMPQDILNEAASIGLITYKGGETTQAQAKTTLGGTIPDTTGRSGMNQPVSMKGKETQAQQQTQGLTGTAFQAQETQIQQQVPQTQVQAQDLPYAGAVTETPPEGAEFGMDFTMTQEQMNQKAKELQAAETQQKPQAGVRGEVTSRIETNWKAQGKEQYGTITGNTFTSNPQTSYQNKNATITDLQKATGYEDMNAEEYQELLYNLNKDQYTNKINFIRGTPILDSSGKPTGRYLPDWMQDKATLKLPDPLNQTKVDVAKMDKNFSVSYEKAIKQSEDNLTQISKNLQSNVNPQTGRFINFDEYMANYDQLKRELGHIAKYVGDPTSPGARGRFDAMTEQKVRVINNLGGIEAVLQRVLPNEMQYKLLALEAEVDANNKNFAYLTDKLEWEKGIWPKEFELKQQEAAARLAVLSADYQKALMQIAEAQQPDATQVIKMNALSGMERVIAENQTTHPTWNFANYYENIPEFKSYWDTIAMTSSAELGLSPNEALKLFKESMTKIPLEEASLFDFREKTGLFGKPLIDIPMTVGSADYYAAVQSMLGGGGSTPQAQPEESAAYKKVGADLGIPELER